MGDQTTYWAVIQLYVSLQIGNTVECVEGLLTINKKTPDAFRQYANTQVHCDGINITRGAQCDHVWSYVAGHSLNSHSDCPHSTDSASSHPQSIGDRYYCESGDPAEILSDNPLWDGQQFEGTFRIGTNFPPRFTCSNN